MDSLEIWSAAIPEEALQSVAVYGEASVRVPPGVVPPDIAGLNPLIGNIWFQAFALAMLAAYCFMLYYYREQVFMCVNGLVDFKPEGKLTDRHGHLYGNFIAYAVVLFTAASGMGMTKAAAVTGGAWTSEIPGWAVPLAPAIFLALAAIILSVQAGMLKAAGKLIYATAFTDTIVGLKTMHLAATAVFVTPLIILYSGKHPVWDTIMMYLSAILLTAITAAFLFRSFLLFVRQKVSIFIWFLYLCAVEIFPPALVIALAVKNF